jgi:hypothetical protein
MQQYWSRAYDNLRILDGNHCNPPNPSNTFNTFNTSNATNPTNPTTLLHPQGSASRWQLVARAREHLAEILVAKEEHRERITQGLAARVTGTLVTPL